MKKGTLLGKGRDGEVLYWGNNRVLKLFWEQVSEEKIEFEFHVSKMVQNHYDYTPKTFDNKIEVKNREGIIYEYIEGKPMPEELLRNPLKIRKYAKVFAKLHTEMHKQQIPGIRSQKVYFEKRIREEPLLSENQKRIIIEYLRNFPEGSTLCHGDYHMENVLVSGTNFFILDWSNLTAGNPNADIARTMYILRYAYDPASTGRSFFLNLIIKTFRYYFVKKYIRTYKRLKKLSLKEVRKWNLIVYAVRLGEEITEEQDVLTKLIGKEIDRLQIAF
jgi:uncharacterized protein (TIGR02172 family)